jgi:ABC-2 type transport system ATP-binding protein
MLAGEGRTILISSHVLSEVAQTADEVVIIHRGKLVRHAAMGEVEAMAAGSTTVRSPAAERLAALLGDAGIAATAAEDGRLRVQAPPERVGEIAAEHAIVLHELSVERASLEEVFLELTGAPGERGA